MVYRRECGTLEKRCVADSPKLVLEIQHSTTNDSNTFLFLLSQFAVKYILFARIVNNFVVNEMVKLQTI